MLCLMTDQLLGLLIFQINSVISICKVLQFSSADRREYFPFFYAFVIAYKRLTIRNLNIRQIKTMITSIRTMPISSFMYISEKMVVALPWRFLVWLISLFIHRDTSELIRVRMVS